MAPETAGSAGASVYPRGFSLVFGGWSSSFMHYQKQEQPGGRIISFPCKPTPSCAGNTHPGSSGSCCSQVGEAGLGNLLVPLVLHEGFSERQKKQRKKNPRGFAKVFSCYQPLWALLSGVWEGSQEELWSRMELERYLGCRF